MYWYLFRLILDNHGTIVLLLILLDQTSHVYCVSHRILEETESIFFLLKEKPSHQNSRCIWRSSQEKNLGCLRLKIALSYQET